MEKVYISPLKLKIFELRLKQVKTRTGFIANLEWLLADTKGMNVYPFPPKIKDIILDEEGREDIKAFIPAAINTPIYTNPKDEIECAEEIVFNLWPLIAQSKADEQTKQTQVALVKEWLESVKQRNQVKDTKSKGLLQQNQPEPDYDGIVAMFSNKRIGRVFADNLKNELVREHATWESVAGLAARTHKRHELNNIFPKWKPWVHFWGEVKRCLGATKELRYQRSTLLKEYGRK